MVDGSETIIDIVFHDDDGRHNFTENKHPRAHGGKFGHTPVNTHYEAKHKADKSKSSAPANRAAAIRRKLRDRRRKKRDVDKEAS